MTDTETAKALLDSGEYTIVLCKNRDIVTSQKSGIAPMLDFIERGIELDGYSAADKIVGKAAALLFVLVGIKAVYAEVLSESGAETLRSHSVPFSYGTLCSAIKNRGTGICPMEQTVADIQSPDEAHDALVKKLDELRNGVKK